MYRTRKSGALYFLTSACGAHQSGDEGPAAGEPSLEVTVEVENQNFYDARIYLIEYGSRRRLGSVPGNSTRSFRFRSKSDQGRFVIDSVGGREVTSSVLKISPGGEIVLTVTPSSHRLRLRG